MQVVGEVSEAGEVSVAGVWKAGTTLGGCLSFSFSLQGWSGLGGAATSAAALPGGKQDTAWRWGGDRDHKTCSGPP